MSEQDVSPPGGHTQVAPPIAYAYPQVPPMPVPAPARRSRAWMWWTLGIVFSVSLLFGGCALSLAVLAGTDSGSWASVDSVAVIRIDGVIAGTGDYYSGYVTPEYFYDQIDQAQEDESVKAIVLRVDSPGGTVAASEEISRYVKQCSKPVFVSTGDINASGAYMVSSQADEIWALSGSAIGSIGVISQIPNASRLLDKLGVEFQVITAGKNKDTGSAFRPLTKAERALIQGQVDEIYTQFIDTVAKGRGMKRSAVEELATGWTWNGDKALKLGLIDKIGTYEDALDAAAKAGGIKGDYDIITYEPDPFDDLFGSMFGLSSVLKRLSSIEAALPEIRGRETLAR